MISIHKKGGFCLCLSKVAGIQKTKRKKKLNEKEKDLKQFKNFYDFSPNKLQVFGLDFLPNILQPFFLSLRLPANFSVGLYKI